MPNETELYTNLIFRKFNDDFDVVRMPLECLLPFSNRFSARDQPREPAAIGFNKSFLGLFPMPAVRVYGAEDHAVFENHHAVDRSEIKIYLLVVGRDSRETEDPVIPDLAHRITNHRRSAGAFDDNVRSKANVLYRSGMIFSSELAD